MTDDRNIEQIYRSAVSGLYARLRNNYDFLYRKFGTQGFELIAEMSREYGLTVANRAKNKLKNNSLDSVAGYLMRIFNTVTKGKDVPELIKESPSRYIIKVHECPLYFENQAMCLAHTIMEKTVVETLNPSIKYNIRKSIPAGDPYCEHMMKISNLKTANLKSKEIIK